MRVRRGDEETIAMAANRNLKAASTSGEVCRPRPDRDAVEAPDDQDRQRGQNVARAHYAG